METENLTITKIETDEPCPNCGNDYLDMYYVLDWSQTLCDECLDRQLKKYGYKI